MHNPAKCFTFVPIKNTIIMTPEQRAKDFAKWLIIYTEDVQTIGTCRRYKNIIYNVDELYDKWEEFKEQTKKKF